jgi:transglutaminase superfamily protein
MSPGAVAAAFRVSPADRRRALEAGVELTRASLELAMIRSTRTVELLGAPRTVEGTEPMAVARQHEAEQVGRVVTAVARRLPWHPTCLRQALAVQRMLRRRGIASRLHLGVAGAGVNAAHAWVTVDGRPVVGRRGIERFVPIAAFE